MVSIHSSSNKRISFKCKYFFPKLHFVLGGWVGHRGGVGWGGVGWGVDFMDNSYGMFS